jgi:hypothetical protein
MDGRKVYLKNHHGVSAISLARDITNNDVARCFVQFDK